MKIGNNFNFNDGEFILPVGMKNQKLSIGNNCLFSSRIFIQTNDGHSIYDIKSKELLNNKGGDIQIGDHCWIGYCVSILKNASLCNNIIVGANSVVTKKFNIENSIICCNRANIIRNGVN